MGVGILGGLRIVEISAFVAAPLGGATLAAMGADVIRIDPPGGGVDIGKALVKPSIAMLAKPRADGLIGAGPFEHPLEQRRTQVSFTRVGQHHYNRLALHCWLLCHPDCGRYRSAA